MGAGGGEWGSARREEPLAALQERGGWNFGSTFLIYSHVILMCYLDLRDCG